MGTCGKMDGQNDGTSVENDGHNDGTSVRNVGNSEVPQNFRDKQK